MLNKQFTNGIISVSFIYIAVNTIAPQNNYNFKQTKNNNNNNKEKRKAGSIFFGISGMQEI